MEDLITKIEKRVNVPASNNTFVNVSSKAFEEAERMFRYLSFCPISFLNSPLGNYL